MVVWWLSSEHVFDLAEALGIAGLVAGGGVSPVPMDQLPALHVGVLQLGEVRGHS